MAGIGGGSGVGASEGGDEIDIEAASWALTACMAATAAAAMI
jgi:hypothetical protein